MASEKVTQKYIDDFYKENGKCCAGCDHWDWVNSLVGECKKSAPTDHQSRISMTGITSMTAPPESGHIVTTRDHLCGDFIDTYDWGEK